MANSVTVRDVARQAAVSPGTVSRVFNNHSSVTPETRERVLKVASEIGYLGPYGQSATSRSNNGTLKELGFFLYDLLHDTDKAPVIDPFWSHLLWGVENEAAKNGIKVTPRAIGYLSQTPQALLSAVNNMGLGGIILVGAPEDEIIIRVKAIGLPVVLLDNYSEDIALDAVLCDNFEGAKKALHLLISYGHKRIAFIGGPLLDDGLLTNKCYSIQQRAEGYRKALQEAHIPFDPDLFETSNLQIEQGFAACNRLIARNLGITAIFCSTDLLATGAMKALHQAGLNIPGDISIVGFDDIDMSGHLTPALTTIRSDKHGMGGWAVKTLIERVNNPEAVPITHLLRVELVQRQSVGPVKAQ